jgi:ribose 5-phosphate isomerase B
MNIAIGCDHAGYPLKNIAIETIQNLGHSVIDMGTVSEEAVDYPDFAVRVGRAIQDKHADRGILLCGSGIGACIAANKMKGVYAGICHDTYSAHQGVEHDNMNVVCLGARIIGAELMCEIIKAFLDARFLGNDIGQERHARRVAKIIKIESENMA